ARGAKLPQADPLIRLDGAGPSPRCLARAICRIFAGLDLAECGKSRQLLHPWCTRSTPSPPAPLSSDAHATPAVLPSGLPDRWGASVAVRPSVQSRLAPDCV